MAPPKKPDVAAFIDSILLIDGPEINLSNGMDKIIIKKNLFKNKGRIFIQKASVKKVLKMILNNL